MQRPLTFFVAALVLMHATIGCCLHHAHSCKIDCCDVPAATAAACPCDGHEHEEEEASPTPELAKHSGHDHDSHQCEQDSCSFVASKSSSSELDGVFGQPAALAFTLSAAYAGPRPASAAEQPDVVSSAPRLHVVLSVLLI